MNRTIQLFALSLLISVSFDVLAQEIRINAVGHPDVSGYFVYDVTSIGTGGSCQSNANITDLNLQVTASGQNQSFGLGDVITADDTVIEFDGGAWRIDNGCGWLAEKDGWYVGFWPDGTDGSPSDGDASFHIEFAAGDPPIDTYLAVQWVPGGVLPSSNPVPSLTSWGVALFAAIMLLLGGHVIRRARP